MPKKYDAGMMDTVFRMRMRGEQKQALFDVLSTKFDAPSSPKPDASSFWRDFLLSTAEQLKSIKSGSLTPEQFASWMLNFSRAYEWENAGRASPEDVKKFDADWVKRAASGEFGAWCKEFALRLLVLTVYAPESSKEFMKQVEAMREHPEESSS